LEVGKLEMSKRTQDSEPMIGGRFTLHPHLQETAMNNDVLRDVLDLLQEVSGACADLVQRVAVAEEIFSEESPLLYQEYEKRLDIRKSGGQQINIALRFEQLRKKLLQG